MLNGEFVEKNRHEGVMNVTTNPFAALTDISKPRAMLMNLRIISQEPTSTTLATIDEHVPRVIYKVTLLKMESHAPYTAVGVA